MEFRLSDAIEVLETTPGVLRAMLAGVSETWSLAAYGPGTFSPFDVLGHLIDCEREDAIPRARLILEHGTGRVFEPFDHTSKGKPGDGETVEARLATFERLRAESLAALRAMRLTEPMLDLRGRHPAFGEVTLRQLLATWVVHDIHHRAQVCKAMAWQYKEAVGPWRAYLNSLPVEPRV